MLAVKHHEACINGGYTLQVRHYTFTSTAQNNAPLYCTVFSVTVAVEQRLQGLYLLRAHRPSQFLGRSRRCNPSSFCFRHHYLLSGSIFSEFFSFCVDMPTKAAH